jgi:hypothetical protein
VRKKVIDRIEKAKDILRAEKQINSLSLCLQVLWLHQTIVPLAPSAIERICLSLLISFGFIVIYTHF